jgi:hypothetical protein
MHYEYRETERTRKKAINCGNTKAGFYCICITPLIICNSAFCPQNAFMHFIHFSKQTAHVSLNSSDKLIFVLETCYVFFEVWTKCLNTI